MSLELRAPAKLNLGLQVLRRREDDYHDIRSVFVPIAWYDRLEIAEAEGLSLACTDAELPEGPENLCWQAAEALANRMGRAPNVSIRLHKRIPHGAGLGGGSSDAAAVLRGCARLWEEKISTDELRALAAEIGSDVPFFLDPRPVLATGRGERLRPIETRLQDAWKWVVVVPGERVSSAEAYGWVRPRAGDRSDPAETVRWVRPGRWKDLLVNDFEDPVSARIPVIGEIKRRIERMGAEFAAMTGSGSAVFGLFTEAGTGERAARRLRANEPSWTVWRGGLHRS